MTFIEPWRHVIFAAGGGYIGYNLSKWENHMLVTVNEKRRAFGLPEYKSSTDLLPNITKDNN